MPSYALYQKSNITVPTAWLGGRGGRVGRSAPGGTSIRNGIFDGVINWYIYPSLQIATSNLYLLVY